MLCSSRCVGGLSHCGLGVVAGKLSCTLSYRQHSNEMIETVCLDGSHSV